MAQVILERPYLGRGIFKVYAMVSGKKKDAKSFKTYNRAVAYALTIQDKHQAPIKEI